MKTQLQFNKLLRSFFWCFAFLMLLPSLSFGQTAYNMSTGNKTWDLIGTWVVSGSTYTGTDAGNWASVAIIGSGTSVTSGLRTTKSSATIVTSTAGGFQKPSGNIQFLSSGSTATPEAVAVDLLLDFTGRVAGTLSFDWAAIDNTGTRPTSLRVFWSIDGTTFTEISAAQLLDKESATSPFTGSITNIALPTAFNGSATARLRFYNHAGTTTVGTGTRDKMQIDNIAVTSTSAPTLSSEPTTQADTVAFTSVGSSAMTVGWNNGNGNRRAVFMKETAGTITNPSDGVAYTASANWSSKGTQLGTSGYYCIYDGTGSSVALTNLASNTNYVMQVFEYNADSASVPTAATINYNVATATSNPNNQTTLTPSLGTSPGIPITGLSYAFGSGPSNESATFKIAGTNFTNSTGNITVTPSSNIEIFDGATWQATAFILPFTASTISTSQIYKVRLKAGLAIATYASELVTISGGGATNATISVSGNVVAVPVLSTSPTSYTGLTYVLGAGPSTASATFAITANYLVPASGNITLTPSSNIEIYDGTTWQSAAFDVAYTAGAISTTSIYKVRLKAGLAVATYGSETVGLSNGTTTASISVSGSVTDAAAPLCPSATAVTSSTAQTLCQGTAAASLTATLTNTGVTGTPTLAYQWYYNTTNSNTVSGATAISGATLDTFTPLTTVTEVGTRYYFCVGYATDGACTQSSTTQSLASNAVSVTVNGTPATPTVSNNGPVCQGTSLMLSTPTVTNATYSWTGPNTFVSSSQNPVVSASATTAMAGDYFLTISVNGCSSASSLATTVVVNPTPTTPTTSNNGPVCLGDTLSLSTPTVTNATYSWSGPNSFSSSSQNPTVSNATSAVMAGTYNVTVTVSGCASAAGTTTATVNSALVVGSVSALVTPTYGSNLVISQVYGGGGNAGATYTNDFVELYNPTNAPISLSGYSIQYASKNSVSVTLSGTSAITNLTGTISAGKYFLISLASGGVNGIALPTSDINNAATNMSGTDGKVWLCNSTTGLTLGTAGSPTSTTNVIDLVGFGVANYYEGTSAAPAPSNTTSIKRASNGCTDSNNNSADFVSGVASPRNSATAANTCSSSSYTESICTGATPSAVSVATASGSTGTYTYQWYSYNGTTTPTLTPATSSWTAVNTGLTLTTSALTQNTTYACFVTPVGCGTGAWASNYRQITVNSIPATPTITPLGSTSIITGGSVTLTASTGTTYLWSTGATTASIVVSTAGNYTVQVTNASGCLSAASTSVTVYVLPTITTTTPASNLTTTSATLSGAITNIGASAITATGIVYAVTTNNATPLIGGTAVIQLSTAVPNAGTGTFSENTVATLLPNTNYSYRAYATSSQGTSYGVVATFNTLSNAPNVTVTSSNPAFGSVCTAGSSNFSTASFTFNGINLDGTNLIISSTAPQLTFATTQTGTYNTTLSLPAGATVTGQVVWVKFIPTATGAFSGTAAISGGGLVTPLSVPTSGTGINTPVVATTGVSSLVTSTGATLTGSYFAGCSIVTASGIEYSLTNTFTSSATISGLPAVVTSLLPNTLYYYRAYATDATGTVNGTTLSFTTLDLSAPVAITATPISYDSFTANWNAVTAATSYSLDVSTSATFTIPSVIPGAIVFNNTGSTGATGWTETAITQQGGAAAYLGLLGSTSTLITPSLDLTSYAAIKLNFKARSYGGTNASANTITVSVSTNNGTTWTTLATRTPASSTLTAVNFFDLSAYNTSQVKIRLQTLAATGAIGAGVDDLILSGDQTVLVTSFVTGYDNLTVNGTSQVVTGLTPSTTYYYRVRATSASSTSANSNTIAVTTTPPPPTFGGITAANATVCANSTTTFNLTGLIASSTSTISYTINNGAAQTVSGVVANASGAASFDLVLPYSYNGQNLALTQIERSDLVSPILTVSTNNTVLLSVNPTSVAGTASGVATICSGTGTIVSLVGTTGTIQWQQSADGVTGWTNVASATSGSLNTGNLTTTTYYHAVVTSGVCTSATSNAVKITINANVTYYADADHDGYGNPAITQVSCLGVPFGYAANNTDCDDTRANTHPGAIDICGDGIDNDCNGTIDNVGMIGGCAPVVSYVTPAQCGTTLSLLDDQVYAALVANAQGYRWRITKMIAGSPSTLPADIQMLDTGLRVFKFTQLASYAFNTTYQIEVAVRINNTWQPYYGAACTVSTPATTTKIITAQCGTTLALMTDVVYANLVSYTTGYRFKVTNLLTNYVQVIDRNVREFRFNLLANIAYSTPYKIEVAIKNTNGTYMSYGPSCEVTTPLFPTTSLQDSQCDYTALSATETIYAKLVSNATNYRFSVTNSNIGYGYVFDTTLRAFVLNSVPSLLPSTTYSVKVMVKIGGVWGPYGKICTVTTPGTSKAIASTDKLAAMFYATAYPNPFAENFKLDIKTSSEEPLQVKVYDMLGKLIENRNLDVTDVRALQIGSEYPSGVYNVIVSQGEDVKTLRVIKR